MISTYYSILDIKQQDFNLPLHKRISMYSTKHIKMQSSLVTLFKNTKRSFSQTILINRFSHCIHQVRNFEETRP